MTLWSPARADHFPPPAGGPDRREGAGWGPQSWPRVWPSHSHRSPASTEPSSEATCTTCFLPHGREVARAPPKQPGWTELCGPNPRALSRFKESGFGPQNYPEEVDGITQTYQGCRRAERGHSTDGTPSLASRRQNQFDFVHTHTWFQK